MPNTSDTAIRWCRGVLRTAFVITNNVYCIPAYVVWVILLRPLLYFIPELYWKIEGFLFHWLLAMVSLWSWSAGYEVAEVGDDITACVHERTLVLANHQSTADVPLLMSTFNARPGVLSRLMWIMDRLFRYTNFGIVSVLHGDFFIVSGKKNRESSIKDLTEHIKSYYTPIDRNFMVLFPEGGFLRKRKETSQKYATKHNLPVLNHVSLPRVGALKAIVDEVGPYRRKIGENHNNVNNIGTNNVDKNSTNNKNHHSTSDDKLKWVLDITIGYENAKPLDLTNIVTGMRKPCVTQMHYRLFPSTDIPSDHEEMTKWLYKRFEEKEKLLEYFYKNGEFPEHCPDGVNRSNKPIIVEQNPTRYLFLSLFYIISTVIHFRVFYVLYQYICHYLV